MQYNVLICSNIVLANYIFKAPWIQLKQILKCYFSEKLRLTIFTFLYLKSATQSFKYKFDLKFKSYIWNSPFIPSFSLQL